MLPYQQLYRVFLLLVITCSQISYTNASSVRQVNIDEMLELAEFIFEGEVVNIESRWNDNRSSINTYVTFDIIDVIHGLYDSSSIELSFSGGSADGLSMQIEGMIYPDLGEQGIYFVEAIGETFINPIVGWSQGRFLIQNEASGEQVMRTAQHQPIFEMTGEAATAQTLSLGVAAGLRTGKSFSQARGAITKPRFKQELRDMLAKKNLP